MRERCERLSTLASALASEPPGLDVKEEAGTLRREIESAIYGHHRGEEEVLFPALIESVAGSDPVCLNEMTAFLAAEHRALEASWHPVHEVLGGIGAGERAASLAPVLGTFADAYLRHLEREEQELFPMAARLLG